MGRIALHDIRKSYGAVDVLKGIDLTIEEGELAVFVGPSGCGKSTLLRMIAGLDRPTSGRIDIDGADVTQKGAADRGLAMVFQSYALYPHMTVRANMAFGLENTRMAKAEIDTRIAEAARLLEIEPLLNRRPGQLSGGQRQRVAIGRAIVRRPTAFLLDEPLSNLDAELRVSMRAELSALHGRLGATMIHVTHDQVEAMTMATHIGVLDHGRLVQFGSPRDIYENPVSTYVATRLGQPRINLLPAAMFPGAPAGAAQIGLRPEHIALGEGQEAEVRRTEHLGDQTRLHLRLQGHDIITLSDRAMSGAVRLSPRNPLWFDAQGARVS
jgi:multiple sugar transport system ATP-binding protein